MSGRSDRPQGGGWNATGYRVPAHLKVLFELGTAVADKLVHTMYSLGEVLDVCH